MQTNKVPKRERRAMLDAFLRTSTLPEIRNQETRDLTAGSPTVTQTASAIVQAAFYATLLRALKRVDALFDPNVTTFVSSRNGSAMLVPSVDDTGNAATVVAEAARTRRFCQPQQGCRCRPRASTSRAW